MDNRRDFLKKATLLASGAGMYKGLPDSIRKALSINPAPGSTFMDAEHIVILMQENRSFDHTFGSLQGVRGFNDPRAIHHANKNPVWLQTDKEGETYAPFHLDIKGTNATWMSSLPHSWSNQVDARNEGRHDKWLDAKHSGNNDYAAMPLTMGYYTREDIPFYYALADAFTICDQNFCSALTGTTPNRLYFWTGTIRERQDAEALARVWNGDADYDNWTTWTTFPERLEEQGISWKVYQNEISAGVGFQGEEDAWLANFTDNPLEFFSQYNVKLAPAYIENLPKAAIRAAAELRKMEAELPDTQAEKAEELGKKIEAYKQYLIRNTEEQKISTLDKFEQLSPHEKSLHQKGFVTNKNDPHYHHLSTLKYMDGGIEREVEIPKGDVLHQFRADVRQGKLPTVSWLVAPENFSDHPGAAWYGSWYISEVMDILTSNPEVWKKTIFILAYDENDGYFDHVPPYTVPHPSKPATGSVSPGINPSVEYVLQHQQSSAEDARESPIGLGFRVPLLIASPWSRGGWVNSEVCDHTSCLQFLETYLSGKFGKKIRETNISSWRRAICGDLRSAFRPYQGENISVPASLQRDEVVKNIHKAKFKKLPSNYKKLTTAEIEKIRRDSIRSGLLPMQEKGTRPACGIPYELYADGQLSADKKKFEIKFAAGKQFFGDRAAGSAFNVFPMIPYQDEVPTWTYTAEAGDEVSGSWSIDKFVNQQYHLQLHGPNGFFREFMGDEHDPELEISCGYRIEKGVAGEKADGSLVLSFQNHAALNYELEIIDNCYHTPTLKKTINAGSMAKANQTLLRLGKSHGWYDITVRLSGNRNFHKRFAGHVETGESSITDPAMGMRV